MKNILSLSAMFLIISCESTPIYNKLGSCWDVNKLELGHYTGDGVLISSMEGMVLHSADCAPRDDVNRFALSKDARNYLNDFIAKNGRKGALKISFSGAIDVKNSRKILNIEKINSASEMLDN